MHENTIFDIAENTDVPVASEGTDESFITSIVKGVSTSEPVKTLSTEADTTDKDESDSESMFKNIFYSFLTFIPNTIGFLVKIGFAFFYSVWAFFNALVVMLICLGIFGAYVLGGQIYTRGQYIYNSIPSFYDGR